MLRTSWFTVVAIAAATWLGASDALAQATVAPADGGFRVVFPVPPEEKPIESADALGPVKGVVWVVRADDVAYVVDYADYAHDVEIDSELDADAQNFAQQLAATVTSTARRQVRRAGGGPLPGLDFSVDGAKVSGAGIAVVDGRRAYVAAAVSIKPHDGSAEIDRFLKSFELIAAKR
jgi:hypothetical protein